MKDTRKIFWLYGAKKEINQVLEEAERFKAITVLNEFSSAEITNVFESNKNAVIPTEIKVSENYRKGQFLIHVTSEEKTTREIESENIINPKGDIVLQFKAIAEKYEVDIGDYIPVDTETFTNKGSGSGCIVCNIYNARENYNKKMVDIVIYESENFFVVPALGTLLPGYLMICPKKHIMSCAECTAEEFLELKDVIKNVSIILENTFSKKVLIFENGSGKEGCGKKHSSSIVHAHVHIIPTDFRISPKDIERIKMHETTFDKLYEKDKNPYIFIMDQDKNCLISDDVNIYRPRQYIRQLISDAEKMPGTLWDWRKHAFSEITEETVLEIAEYLRENFTELNDRIIKGTKNFLKEMDFRSK